MFILALEASTSSAKAMYYDTDSEAFELRTRPYTIDYLDNHTAFRPDRIYDNMVTLGRELVQGRTVDIIALCSAWHSVGLFDASYLPVTPMYQWSSTYGSELSQRLRRDGEYVSSYYNTTGCMVNCIYPFFKLLRLAEDFHLPDYQILGQGSYNNLRMTGKRVTTDCLLSASGLLDIRKLEYAPALLKELNISQNQLAEICSYKEELSLCDAAARELGVKAGIPVIPTCADGALNQAGAGALGHGTMTFSLGTSGAIRMSEDKPQLSPDNSTWCYRSPVTWLSGAATNGGTNCIEWFRRMAFDAPVEYAEIERGISNVEAAPIFLPFIFGERCPGWDDEFKGGFYGLTDKHSRYDMYQGIEEGILFNLLQCYQALTALRGEPERIRFSGGILRSPRWSQMCADIFNRELETDKCEHASLMGAVALAKERLGLIGNLSSYTLPSSGIIYPNSEMVQLYERKYILYKNCYDELKSRRKPISINGGIR